MTKTIVQMLLSSRNKLIYLMILIVPTVFLNIIIYNNTLNFSILLLVNFIATFSSLIISFEIISRERGINLYSYLKVLKNENFVMLYRTFSIFWISSVLTVITWLIMILIYAKSIFIGQQIIYLLLILLANLFYIYFLQYLLVSIKNVLVRNSTIFAVTSISMLSLMTRSMATFMMYATITGLFLAVTFMNRRLTEELKREASKKKY